MAGEVNINLSQYAENKAKGFIKLVNIEGVIHYIERRFHPQTGEPTPVFTPISVDALKKSRDGMAKDLAALDQVIADAEKAEAGPTLGTPAA
jgi:hypothetical protein